ncbi:hypothetical protein PPYR_10467 [Photinus pyralis]|uniref:Reverse transcriptase domain-containing protein n=1 Tax=Photinus pyralis TaxID=7054 RepID=A0A5N4AGJ5_PHOPY|nr:hypothetical protein PPYR_10467 [Photinus pyralis]
MVLEHCQRHSLNKGVPQGSILGPLLFLLFVNDLKPSLQVSTLIQYADDTSCLFASETAQELSDSLTLISKNMVEWCNNNNLILNTQKTALVAFTYFNDQSLLVKMSGKSIQQTEVTKFLGVHIDQNLKWCKQVDYVVGRLNSACYAIRYLKERLSLNSIRAYYFAAVHCVLAYSILLWFNASDTRRVFIAQKRIIRAMVGLPSAASCRTSFQQLKILTLPSLGTYVAKHK